MSLQDYTVSRSSNAARIAAVLAVLVLIALIAVPLLIQSYGIFAIAYAACWAWRGRGWRWRSRPRRVGSRWSSLWTSWGSERCSVPW